MIKQSTVDQKKNKKCIIKYFNGDNKSAGEIRLFNDKALLLTSVFYKKCCDRLPF